MNRGPDKQGARHLREFGYKSSINFIAYGDCLRWINVVRCTGIEGGTEAVQLSQLLGRLHGEILSPVPLNSFMQLFQWFEQKVCVGSWLIILDEFPRFVMACPALPSLLQGLIDELDHSGRTDLRFACLGSSQRMMHSHFLQDQSPLYGRARRIIDIGPMNFTHFCEFLGWERCRDAFVMYALVGGVPKYWESLVGQDLEPVALVERLYYGPSPFLRLDLSSMLTEEMVDSQVCRAILAAMGEGESTPRSISSKIGVSVELLKQPISRLVNCGLIHRSKPAFSAPRDKKRVFYEIADPALRFFQAVVLRHEDLWETYSYDKKRSILMSYAGNVLTLLAGKEKGSHRYWEDSRRDFSGLEFDGVCLDQKQNDALVIYEFKLDIDKSEVKNIIKQKEMDFARSQLFNHFSTVKVIVSDYNILR